MHVAKDELARDNSVRIINIDRPGFGGSTEVDASDRVRAWLEIVPALLEHLGIPYVSVVCHSGGLIYALNTVLHLRHLLHPTRPYVAICAPWIHPSHSGVSLLHLATALPESVLYRFDIVARFFTKAELFTGSSTLFLGDDSGRDWEDQLRPDLVNRVFSENVRGLNQEAMLLLKRTPKPDCWGSWVDIDGFVPLLDIVERSHPGPPLQIEVFYAESDIMVGTSNGPTWFDNCWKKRASDMHFSSCVVPGTDHDRILDIKHGVFGQILRTVACSESISRQKDGPDGATKV